MKTIAVMTKVFLPKTIFAATFVVPSLDWDGPKAVTSKFWVYWALKIPFKPLVFRACIILSVERPTIKLADRAIASHKILRRDSMVM